jgi:hypothetical protein
MIYRSLYFLELQPTIKMLFSAEEFMSDAKRVAFEALKNQNCYSYANNWMLMLKLPS